LKLDEKALFIRKKYLSPHHHELGISHNTDVSYRVFGKISHYELALKIYKISRSPQHPSIAFIFQTIGQTYEDPVDFQQVLSCSENVATIYRHSFVVAHSDIIHIKNIQRFSSKLK
jgi:hypothetical protein